MRIKLQEKRRRELGMTKAELSRASGVQPNVIGWIGAGRFKPYPARLEKIAAVLDVPVPDMLLNDIEVG